ncbi:MAG: hypothetical protein Q8K59_02005 [Nitrosomonas sp.]|nr:hypothetical protein [Nitrosomonas sp.]MDP1949870.1 hypothetical protein [Nitrosomonas sp.]
MVKSSSSSNSVVDFSAALTAANAALTALNDTSAAAELFSFQFDATNGNLFDDTDSDGIAATDIIV